MQPDVTGYTPVIKLKIVVFPAPFGPINATRSPAASENETSWMTRKPPNDFSSASRRRIGALGSAAIIGVPPGVDA